MATWEDVSGLALAMPDASEELVRGDRRWTVRNRGKTPLFVWERPLRKTDLRDLAELDQAPPDGPVLAARTENLIAKQAMVESDPGIYFTIPHFQNYPAVLVHLDRIGLEELRELVIEAWLARAPEKLAAAWAAEHLPPADA